MITINIQEVYLEAKRDDYKSLALLIEFLVMEKKVLTFADDESELNRYFHPKHAERMNKLLNEYKGEV